MEFTDFRISWMIKRDFVSRSFATVENSGNDLKYEKSLPEGTLEANYT